ncbi:hypothetical protein EDD85DRAFT_806316 [Armillaria nabsnona]|nr:hypothetical protein EDD85DRAFT_806316 [Armillaria nabsnona]
MHSKLLYSLFMLVFPWIFISEPCGQKLGRVGVQSTRSGVSLTFEDCVYDAGLSLTIAVLTLSSRVKSFSLHHGPSTSFIMSSRRNA